MKMARRRARISDSPASTNAYRRRFCSSPNLATNLELTRSGCKSRQRDQPSSPVESGNLAKCRVPTKAGKSRASRPRLRPPRTPRRVSSGRSSVDFPVGEKHADDESAPREEEGQLVPDYPTGVQRNPRADDQKGNRKWRAPYRRFLPGQISPISPAHSRHYSRAVAGAGRSSRDSATCDWDSHARPAPVCFRDRRMAVGPP